MSSLIDIVAVIAVVGYVLARQLAGEALRGKRVVVLPIVLTIIGITDLNSNARPVRPADVVFLVLGGVVVAAIGLALGRVTRLESRDGTLWGQLPIKGLWFWLLLIVSRVLLMIIAHGAGAHVAASTAPLLLMLGINRLAQAAVVLPRAMSAGISFAPEKDGRQLFAGLTSGPATHLTTPAPAPVDLYKTADPTVLASTSDVPAAPIDWATLGQRAASHLSDHHREHEERHGRRHHRDDR